MAIDHKEITALMQSVTDCHQLAKAPAGFYNVDEMSAADTCKRGPERWRRRMDKAVKDGKVAKVIVHSNGRDRAYYGPVKGK